MELLLHGNILLVGEGDFSFAVSMVEKLPSNKYRSILATSLETEQSIQKHQYAAKNISQLHEKGVTVRLETDATQLHINPLTKLERFDCIVFNFPHAGGKSNHKKNRKLLNDFFASAVQVLKKQGQILMTLCKGQGGTPADRPMRAWHDSWQVVSMAANSSLILTKVLPFNTEEYTVYTSTGFRSLDKGFHTENALTHVFEMSEPVGIPASLEMVTIKLGTRILSCQPYMYRKLSQIRCINSSKAHPIHRVFDRIIQHLESSASSFKVHSRGIQVPVYTVSKATRFCDNAIVMDANKFHSQQERTENSDLNKIEDFSDFLCARTLNEVALHNEDLVFITDPLNVFDSEIRENIQALYVPVYKPCVISVNQSAVSYHVAIVWPISIDRGSVKDSKPLECLNKAVHEVTATWTDILNKVISRSEIKAEPVHLKDSHSFYGDFRSRLHMADITIRYTGQPSTSGGVVKKNKEPVKVGSSHVKVFGDCTCPSEALVYLTADLCNVACCRYNIEDERLLWSSDLRVLGQFAELKCEKPSISQDFLSNATDSEKDTALCTSWKQSQSPVIQSPSMYPMTFVHDMSFWENPSEQFSVLEYCNIIRDVADDSVTNLELIDTYSDQMSGKCSRCYRLTFQCVDKALSYNTSWKLQSLIRLEVEKKMSIVLR